MEIWIRDFFTYAICRESCTKQAFSKQLGQTETGIFPFLQQYILFSGFYRHYGEHVKRWKGHLLFAVDGSTLPLPRTDALMQVFGGATNQSVSELVSVTGAGLHFFSSEDDACMESMENMDFKDSVFLFDRGYPGYRLLHLLTQKDVKFVMQVKRSANSTVKRFMKSAEKEATVRWYPGSRSMKKLREKGFEVNGKTDITVRTVKAVLNTGEVEVSVTNLFDSQVYTVRDLKEVYGLRRGIEPGYGCLKEELPPICYRTAFKV